MWLAAVHRAVSAECDVTREGFQEKGVLEEGRTSGKAEGRQKALEMEVML